MEEYILYCGAQVCGAVKREEAGLYSDFAAEFSAPPEKLYRIWLHGERGQLPLGVPEWNGRSYCRQRRLANRVLEQIGEIRYAAAVEEGAEHPCIEEGGGDGWIALHHPEYFFKSVTPQLEGVQKCCWKPLDAGQRLLAVPIDHSAPFLLPRYFCFARVQTICGSSYAVFTFDKEDCPIMPE